MIKNIHSSKEKKNQATDLGKAIHILEKLKKKT